nr:retrovirus-related Pol polyprotein from transposon TNT 1-94 [Tanacetum cinerariifolium]
MMTLAKKDMKMRGCMTIEGLEVEYFDTFPTRSEVAYHGYLMSDPIPSLFLRNPIITEGCPSNLKIPCNIGHVHVEKAYIELESLDCNKDEPTKVHDDFKSINFFLDSGEQNCFDGPPQNPSSTTTEDIGSEEENVAQHENDLFSNNSPGLGPESRRTMPFLMKNRNQEDEKWRNAMQQVIKALEKNGTWTLKELPEGKRPIDSKWVYKTKFKSNGEVERYKARLIAKGCTQREGVDYHETFASVANLVTVRTLLAVATKKGWIIHQLDLNNAFLHGDLDGEVYMKIPKGFAKEGETRVCRLRKSLYGLKQASRNWYKRLTSFLLSLNFEQSKSDYSLFTYQKAGVYVAILIYVDDIIIVRDNSEKIQQIKQQLDDEFSIKNLGPLKYFLGIEVAKTSDGAFPFEQGTKLDKGGEEEARVDATQYRRLVGRLLYLQATRHDVTYAVNVLSQFVSDPRQNYLEAAKRVLRLAWVPFYTMVQNRAVISRSSAEAEYRAMTSTVSEILWVRWLLTGMQVQLTTPTSLFCDNQAARHIANNPVYHERTKHVEMDCFFVRERVETRDIETKPIESKLQLADLLTNGLGTQQLRSLLNKMGIRDLHAPS